MARYCSKPVEIEAVRLGDLPSDPPGWFRAALEDKKIEVVEVIAQPSRFLICTPEGLMQGRIGDWIIYGPEGELYPCKDSVFRRKYQRSPSEPVAETSAPSEQSEYTSFIAPVEYGVIGGDDHPLSTTRKILSIGRIVRSETDEGIKIVATPEVQIRIADYDGREVSFSSTPSAARHWAEKLMEFARTCETRKKPVNLPSDAT